MMSRITNVEPLENHFVRLTFTDGSSRDVDLDPYLHGPIFEAVLRDADFFRAVRVDERMGTIVWPNGADIDPDVLYRCLSPAWMERGSDGSGSSSPPESAPLRP